MWSKYLSDAEIRKTVEEMSDVEYEYENSDDSNLDPDYNAGENSDCSSDDSYIPKAKKVRVASPMQKKEENKNRNTNHNLMEIDDKNSISSEESDDSLQNILTPNLLWQHVTGNVI